MSGEREDGRACGFRRWVKEMRLWPTAGEKIKNQWGAGGFVFCWPRGLVSKKSKAKGGAAVFGFLGFGFL